MREFRSENRWSDPTAVLQGRSITVFLDRTTPARYHMDLAFLDERSPPTGGPPA